MGNFYTDERDILELVALLKAHSIKQAVVSPGSTSISFAESLLYDPDIKVYSCIDERSAAYMACGLAEETGEPVIIACTGATAARNYVPALTEAYYRKLPILAVTSSQHFGRVGQHFPQVTDRTSPMRDICKKSVQIPIAYSAEEIWANNVKLNDALLELRRNGGGPVHINIETSFSKVFDIEKLPSPRVIRRITVDDRFPKIRANRILIYVGSHSKFSDELTRSIELFCRKYNAVVLCDHSSNYNGEYKVLGGFVVRQADYFSSCRTADLLIHIGEVSGSYYKLGKMPVWRVNPDGEIRDTFKTLDKVFEMSEKRFFDHYCRNDLPECSNAYYYEWIKEEKSVQERLPELPFSNAWIAQQTASRLPENSEIHFGILNSLRMWNLYAIPSSVNGYSNVGGFGIDGCISTVIGASFADKTKLYYIVLGDLATFYDLNSLGNRHIGTNLRILIVNNGTGFEMRHSGNRGDVFGSEADILFAAGGHYANQSRILLRHYSEDLGFEYMAAESKDQFLENLPIFVSSERRKKSIVFEVFVDVKDEYDAYEITRRTVSTSTATAKNAVKSILGEKGVKTVKNILRKK